jgi:hypothetical protein
VSIWQRRAHWYTCDQCRTPYVMRVAISDRRIAAWFRFHTRLHKAPSVIDRGSGPVPADAVELDDAELDAAATYDRAARRGRTQAYRDLHDIATTHLEATVAAATLDELAADPAKAGEHDGRRAALDELRAYFLSQGVFGGVLRPSLPRTSSLAEWAAKAMLEAAKDEKK